MASKSVLDCDPRLQKLIIAFLNECKKHGLEVLIYCTYRSDEEQNAAYALGRTIPGKKITNAKGGQSKHNATVNGKPASLAFDAVPTLYGKPMWTNDAMIDKMGLIGESVGLEWAGRWVSFKERVHFQLKG